MSENCAACARRSELLVRMGIPLDFCARDTSRLWDALKLPSEQLIDALGGRRRAELHAWHASAEPVRQTQSAAERTCHNSHPVEHTCRNSDPVECICRHNDSYPHTLKAAALAPHELYVIGGTERLQEILTAPAVAIVGTRRCTDYGLEIARALGRDLAGSGVCVIAELSDGIAHGVHAGALEAGGRSVAIAAGGVEKCSPRCCEPIRRSICAKGCVLSELPCGAKAHRWAALARARTLAMLAELVIVVEADELPRELACVDLACALGKRLGAVPGRVGSRTSRATNRLIKQGAALVRGAQDALDLLYGELSQPARERPGGLERRLQAALDRINEGSDTLAKLGARHAKDSDILLALAELELRGMVVRGDGGRYIPCAVVPG